MPEAELDRNSSGRKFSFRQWTPAQVWYVDSRFPRLHAFVWQISQDGGGVASTGDDGKLWRPLDDLEGAGQDDYRVHWHECGKDSVIDIHETGQERRDEGRCWYRIIDIGATPGIEEYILTELLFPANPRSAVLLLLSSSGASRTLAKGQQRD